MKKTILPIVALFAMISCSEKHPSEPLNVEIQDSLKFGCDFHNPLLDHLYTADPTAVEYEGRLYVYGTNDQQQCDEVHPDSAKGTHDLVFIMKGETLKVDKWIIK